MPGYNKKYCIVLSKVFLTFTNSLDSDPKYKGLRGSAVSMYDVICPCALYYQLLEFPGNCRSFCVDPDTRICI